MTLKRKRPVHNKDNDTHKQHRFQSFSERIENLNIDVLRKVRAVIPDAGDDDEDTYVFSYFSESVRKWRDLNLSATFTAFYHAASPFSDSLPQVVHHQETIVSLLEEHIARQDPLAMASLLDMLVQLARDLGEDFYTKYWPRTVSLLCETVSHPDFVVVEAAFNTLSWLLKYLARPLITSLPTTFIQLSPLLGKDRQKQHVRRFASEALAFLLRRVKNPDEIVEVMLSDLGDNEEYSEAVTNVFIEGMKAPARTLHSKALGIFSALLKVAHSVGENSKRILNGVLEQIIYESTKEALKPLLELIIEGLKVEGQDLGIDLLILFCSFKGGSKVAEWPTLTDALVRLLSSNGVDTPRKLQLAALVLARADPVTSKKTTGKVLEILIKKSESQIGALSRLIGKLNRNYFDKWVLEDLTKYINTANESMFDEIALTIIAIRQDGLVEKAEGPDWNARLNNHIISPSSPFVNALNERVGSLDLLDPGSTTTWTVLQVIATVGLNSALMEVRLNNLFLQALTRMMDIIPDITGVLLSRFLGEIEFVVFNQLVSTLDAHAESLFADVTFLDGLGTYLSTRSESVASEVKPFSRHLERNLSYPSHIIRNSSLRNLKHFSRHTSPILPDLVEAMLEIENTPRTVENIRSTSLAMRKLTALSTVETDPFLIAFCFGLLTINFAPLWADACAVLKAVADRSGAKLWEKAFADLNVEDNEEANSSDSKSVRWNLEELVSGIWEEQQLELTTRTELLHEKELEKNSPERHPSPRSQSLRVLLEIPHLAEQHSRDLVPLFLSLESPSTLLPTQWARKDRLSLLTLFTKFVNPKALFKPAEVRTTLYTLLHNGDAKFQLVALDGILTWKEPELTTYREGLHNLLDEGKFREELTSLIHVDAEESKIQEGHRAALMQVVVRILYGQALVRQGNEGKRGAILSALANLHEEERRIFFHLALLPFAGSRGALRVGPAGYELVLEKLGEPVNEKKMVGFVMMLQNLAKALGAGIKPYLHDVLEGLVISMWKSKLPTNEVEDDSEDVDGEVAEEGTTKTARTIRKTSMKAFGLLVDTCPDFAWERYLALVLKEFVSDRLATLPDENIQSPSTRLHLFDTLAQHHQTVLLLSLDPRIVPSILGCIEMSTVNISIFETVLRIVANVFTFSQNEEIASPTKEKLIMPNLTQLLGHLTVILVNEKFQQIVNSWRCLDLITNVLRRSAPLVQDAVHVEHLIEPLLSLLSKPGRLVNEKIKGGLLESVFNLLPLVSDLRPNSPTFEDRLHSLSRLFAVLHDRFARVTLSQTIDLFAEVDSELSEIGHLVGDLNAYDTRRLDAPDFDRRLAAFAKLSEELYLELSPRAWTPILYNLLFFVQDTEEMSLRTGSAFGLERFFIAAQTANLSTPYTTLLSTAVLPAIKKGLKHSNELVRREFAGVLNVLVKYCGDWSPISDLKVLLFEGDEEANFFNNIFHIQHHRQMRAIIRLAKAASDGALRAVNIEQIFIPLLEKFSLDGVGGDANVAAEAVRAVGVLTGSLGWKGFRGIVKRYLGMLKRGDEKERAVVRSVCAMVEHVGKVAQARIQRETTGEDAGQDEFLVKAVVDEFYPPMLTYLHHHEESSIALRVPVAIALVKILQAVPEQVLASKLPAVLTDVAHILRSRSQENRDTSRKTMNEVLNILGPRFFAFVLKELRAALSRGYQLHVLGYTVHSLLSNLGAQHGALDECVKEIVEVLMDDIFGATGSEKDSEGYTSSMKEVKASKSYDSFEILASVTSVDRFDTLVSPIRSFLYELNTVKDGRKVIEALRRIQLGILRNESATPSAVLDFCLTFFQSVQAEGERSTEKPAEATKNHFIVDLKVRRRYDSNHFKANVPKLLRFALETSTGLVKKHGNLLTEERLNSLVPLLGDSLVSEIDELRIASLRLLARVISLRYAVIEEGLEVFIDRAVYFIKQSPFTKSELCQASFKFLSTLIRDRKTFSVPENTVVYILERIRPDLEEPDRQGISFSLIRAILSRSVVLPEVYDIMSEISNIMITNQSTGVRDTTRALYLQFLMDYPQGRERVKKQISFLIKNLQYEFESGRQSVMEVLHQIIFKFGDELLQPILLDLFVGLLLPLANDESATCREMAARLLQSVIENADEERSRGIRTMLRLWAGQTGQPALLKASLHVYRIMLKHGRRSPEDLELCVECVDGIVKQSVDGIAAWDVLEQSLQLLTTLVKLVPSRIFSADREMLWRRLSGFLMCGDVPTRLAASKLFGVLFGVSQAVDTGELKIEDLQLSVTEIVTWTRQFIEQVKDVDSTDELRLQALKNLIFVGRHFKVTASLLSTSEPSDEEDAEERSCLSWLISRVAAEIRYERAVAQHVGLARKMFVQWIVALVSIMEAEELQVHASPLVASLSRFMEDGPTASILKSSLKETRDIADEGLKLIQSKLGTTAYLEIANAVRQEALGRREERKTKRSLEAVTDPEKAAQKKIRQHKKGKESKKRKIEGFKNRRLALAR